MPPCPLPHPPSSIMPVPTFMWGEFDSAHIMKLMDEAYSEAVHWCRNIFKIPFGKAGKDFASELSRLYLAYADCSSLEATALKVCTVRCRSHSALLSKKSTPHALRDAWQSGRWVTLGAFWQSVTPYNLACPSCALLEVRTNQIWSTHSPS